MENDKLKIQALQLEVKVLNDNLARERGKQFLADRRDKEILSFLKTILAQQSEIEDLKHKIKKSGNK